MSGFYDDMPPLVDPTGPDNPYPSNSHIPPPPGASFEMPSAFPSAYGGGSNGSWAGAVWGASPSHDYPSSSSHTYPQWTSSAQNSGWYPTTANQPHQFPGYYSSNAWSTPPSFGPNPIPMQGTYSPYPYSSAPPPLGMPTTYHTSPMRSDTLHQVTSYSPSSASTSSPYSSRRSASVGPRSHRSTVAHRPKNWRHDYRTRTGFASILPKRQTISFGSDNEFYDDIKRAPHSFLQYNSFNPPVSLDLRDDPMSIKFLRLRRPFSQYDLLQYACEPPVHIMRLYHEKLPWYIDIRARSPSGVTIHDLFDQMHDALMVPIRNEDFYNEELDDEDQMKIALAFKERCNDNLDEIARGIRKVDFLKGRVAFEGLTRGKNGMWEIKSKKW